MNELFRNVMEGGGMVNRREGPYKCALLSWPPQEVAQMEGLSEKPHGMNLKSRLSKPQGDPGQKKSGSTQEVPESMCC